MGNPLGQGFSVSAGIVSARGRALSGSYDDFIQTDAAINSGNSGGPLFDATGRVVGVNTAIFSPSGGNVGIGFAVPAHVAARVVADLRDDGVVERGWLGVRIQSVTESLATVLGLDAAEGALVNEVTPGGPAAEAGLEPGDVVLSVAGENVEDPRELIFAVANRQIGQETSFTVWRDGARIEIPVTIGRQPTDMAAGGSAPSVPGTDAGPQLGATVAPLTPELRAQLALPEGVDGLAVVEVDPQSPAAEAGIARGDVITDIGGTPATDAGAVRAALEEAAADDTPALLRVYRDGAHRFVAIPADRSDG
jgi:serine protease Do